MSGEVFIQTGLTPGEMVKFTRLSWGWRQIDLASVARVGVGDVIGVEKNRWVPKKRKARIFQSLGLSE